MTHTVVLVHGAWSAGWAWNEVCLQLAERGIRSVAPDLPGRGESSLPLGDLHEDAAYLAGVLGEIETEIVLAGHSYGGAVMSEAMSRASAAVVHLVYVTGFCLEEGEAFMPLRNAATDDRVMAEATFRSDDGSSALVDPEAALGVLFGEADPEVARAAAAQVGPQLARTFWQPVSTAPWREVPSTYIRCTRDRALPVAAQDVMAARCGTIVDLPTDHFPHLSIPGALTEIKIDLASATFIGSEHHNDTDG